MTTSRGVGRGPAPGDDHPRARLTTAKVQEARRRALAGERYAQIAAWAGVSWEAVRDAVTGATWGHVADPPPVKRRRRWSAEDLAVLAALDSATAATVAARLGRTPHAVSDQRHKRGRERRGADRPLA